MFVRVKGRRWEPWTPIRLVISVICSGLPCPGIKGPFGDSGFVSSPSHTDPIVKLVSEQVGRTRLFDYVNENFSGYFRNIAGAYETHCLYQNRIQWPKPNGLKTNFHLTSSTSIRFFWLNLDKYTGLLDCAQSSQKQLYTLLLEKHEVVSQN
jgi:hypothetical protein